MAAPSPSFFPDPAALDAARARLESIRARLRELGRPDLRLIGVSKTHGPASIRALLEAGLRDFGENRQNEARDKLPLVPVADLSPDAQPSFHHIGPLQSGAARQIPGLFHWVHGASSESALKALAKAAAKFVDEGRAGKAADRVAGVQATPLRYLLQIDLTGEASKAGGMSPEEAEELLQRGPPESEGLHFAGFMTMGPTDQDRDTTRRCFVKLRQLRDRLSPDGELSMGMSGDWEMAAAEGATMVRLGTALFGPRGDAPWVPGSNSPETGPQRD